MPFIVFTGGYYMIICHLMNNLSNREYRNKIAKKKFIPWPIEIRFCEDYHFSEQSPPRLRYWLKVKGKLTDDPALHR
ncbi:acyl-coenzyme A thioesterase 8-like [Musa troglodytarum]|uniref:Acyl-coenzyme A thioesterase 8-like n=1 Tax=Musa troglodytarum TaxID=320322 RepID=A0A9E7KTE4_9LILI|nr:acyl-coenzyme A thioesterase 8-like [Musa troglodytarum]